MQLRRSRRRMHGNSGRGYLPKIKSNSRNMCASNLTNAHRLIHTRSGQPALASYGKTRSLRDPASSALYSQLPMSPNGPTRTLRDVRILVAIRCKADIRSGGRSGICLPVSTAATRTAIFRSLPREPSLCEWLLGLLAAHRRNGGTVVRQTTVRERLTPSATDFTKWLSVRISPISCLPSFPNVRYNPAQLLGHVLGQRGRDSGAANQSA